MHTISVSQLQAALDECLAWVKAGEEVLVTEDDALIAKIVPLESTGLIIPGSGRIADAVWTQPRPKDPTGAGRQALTVERENGR